MAKAPERPAVTRPPEGEFSKRLTLERANDGVGPLGRSEDEEPVFVLCGRDPVALAALEHYVAGLRTLGHYDRENANRFVAAVPPEKIKGAQRAYDAFQAWQGKRERIKVPG